MNHLPQNTPTKLYLILSEFMESENWTEEDLKELPTEDLMWARDDVGDDRNPCYIRIDVVEDLLFFAKLHGLDKTIQELSKLIESTGE